MKRETYCKENNLEKSSEIFIDFKMGIESIYSKLRSMVKEWKEEQQLHIKGENYSEIQDVAVDKQKEFLYDIGILQEEVIEIIGQLESENPKIANHYRKLRDDLESFKMVVSKKPEEIEKIIVLGPDFEKNEIIGEVKCKRFIRLKLEHFNRYDAPDRSNNFVIKEYLNTILESLKLYSSYLTEELKKDIPNGEKKEKEEEIDLIALSLEIFTDNEIELYEYFSQNMSKAWEDQVIEYESMIDLIEKGSFLDLLIEISVSSVPSVRMNDYTNEIKAARKFKKYSGNLLKLGPKLPQEHFQRLENLKKKVKFEELDRISLIDIIKSDAIISMKTMGVKEFFNSYFASFNRYFKRPTLESSAIIVSRILFFKDFYEIAQGLELIGKQKIINSFFEEICESLERILKKTNFEENGDIISIFFEKICKSLERMLKKTNFEKNDGKGIKKIMKIIELAEKRTERIFDEQNSESDIFILNSFDGVYLEAEDYLDETNLLLEKSGKESDNFLKSDIAMVSSSELSMEDLILSPDSDAKLIVETKFPDLSESDSLTELTLFGEEIKEELSIFDVGIIEAETESELGLEELNFPEEKSQPGETKDEVTPNILPPQESMEESLAISSLVLEDAEKDGKKPTIETEFSDLSESDSLTKLTLFEEEIKEELSIFNAGIIESESESKLEELILLEENDQLEETKNEVTPNILPPKESMEESLAISSLALEDAEKDDKKPTIETGFSDLHESDSLTELMLFEEKIEEEPSTFDVGVIEAESESELEELILLEEKDQPKEAENESIDLVESKLIKIESRKEEDVMNSTLDMKTAESHSKTKKIPEERKQLLEESEAGFISSVDASLIMAPPLKFTKEMPIIISGLDIEKSNLSLTPDFTSNIEKVRSEIDAVIRETEIRKEEVTGESGCVLKFDPEISIFTESVKETVKDDLVFDENRCQPKLEIEIFPEEEKQLIEKNESKSADLNESDSVTQSALKPEIETNLLIYSPNIEGDQSQIRLTSKAKNKPTEKLREQLSDLLGSNSVILSSSEFIKQISEASEETREKLRVENINRTESEPEIEDFLEETILLAENFDNGQYNSLKSEQITPLPVEYIKEQEVMKSALDKNVFKSRSKTKNLPDKKEQLLKKTEIKSTNLSKVDNLESVPKISKKIPVFQEKNHQPDSIKTSNLKFNQKIKLSFFEKLIDWVKRILGYMSEKLSGFLDKFFKKSSKTSAIIEKKPETPKFEKKAKKTTNLNFGYSAFGKFEAGK